MDNPSAYFGVCVVFVVLVAPLYLMFRFLVKIVRTYYGFAEPVDEGPPLRICGSCHNTVMEDDFVVCPYCGLPLPPAVVDEAPSIADTGSTATTEAGHALGKSDAHR